MLSDDAMDNYIDVIVNRQRQINQYVLNKMAQHIKEIGMLLPSDIHRLERILVIGVDVRKVNNMIARMTGLQVRDIKRLIKQVAKGAYIDAKPYYDYRHKPYIPFEQNVELQRVVNSIANNTANTYINLSDSRATGFLIRDLSNPSVLKFQSIGDTYKTVIDEAVQAVSFGVQDYNTAMRRTMKQLVDSGVRRLYWDSGYTQRLDTAVRRNILDGIRAVNQGVQDEVGRQFGADGKEISVHINSAPDHEPIQGHQFTNEEYEKLQNGEPFQDVDGEQFKGFDRAIGTLNCRHFAWSIIVGFTKPIYSKQQLKKMIADNQKGYTTADGKHMTNYQCEQYQRKLETEIRKAKDGQIMARQAGNKDLAIEYQTKINSLTSKYNAFSKSCGIQGRKDKMTVSGYHKISTKKP